jgi:putative PIN family toxin of toxin-antitoxin system
MLRAVLDTNIIISGLLWGGLPGRIFQAALNEAFTAVLTEALLAETMRVLSRDKFISQITARQIDLTKIQEQYRAAAEIVEPADILGNVVRDPKDVMVLACAVGGKADYIVSGDHDLLTLVVYENIAIVSAAQFLVHLST